LNVLVEIRRDVKGDILLARRRKRRRRRRSRAFECFVRDQVRCEGDIYYWQEERRREKKQEGI